MNKLTAEFVSSATEQSFRVYVFETQRKNILWIMGVPVLIIFMNSLFDLYLLSETYFLTISAYRLIYLGISTILFFAILKCTQHSQLDWIVLGWLLLTAFLILLVESTRPFTYSYHRFAVDFMFVIFVYLLVSAQLMNQIVVGVTFTIPVIFMVSYGEYNIDSTSFATIVLTLVTANLAGWFISRKNHVLHREWYRAIMERNQN